MRQHPHGGTSGSWPHVILLDPYNAGLALARRMIRLGARVTVIESQPVVGRSRSVEGIVEPYKPGGERWLEILRGLASGSAECVALTGTDRASEWLVQMADRLPANMHAFEQRDSAHLALMSKEQAEVLARLSLIHI